MAKPKTKITKFVYECPPLQITIRNNSNKIKKAVLFGLSRNIFKKNFGLDQGIIIIPHNGVEYSECLISSALNPFQVIKTRIRTLNEKQIKCKFSVISYNMYGQQLTDYSSKLISIPNEKDTMYLSDSSGKNDIIFDITSGVQLEYEIFPKTSVEITFYIGKSCNIARNLSGKHTLVEFAKPKIGIYPTLIKSKSKNKTIKNNKKQ